MPFCELNLEQNKNEITTILINEVMKKMKQKRDYKRPECKVHKLELERFICTLVYPDAPQTNEAGFEDGGEIDGGTLEF